MYVLVCSPNLSGDAIRQHNNRKQTTWPATENNIPPKTPARGETSTPAVPQLERKRNPIMGGQINVSALKSGLIRGKSDRGKERERGRV